MKSLLVILFSLVVSNQVMASNESNEIVDQFKDKVKQVIVTNDHLEVHFKTHAAIYKVNKDHPKFKEIQNKLEEKVRDQKVVKITSSIPKMEIKEISE